LFAKDLAAPKGKIINADDEKFIDLLGDTTTNDAQQGIVLTGIMRRFAKAAAGLLPSAGLRWWTIVSSRWVRRA